MKYLYAPWRDAYIKNQKQRTGCVLCNNGSSSTDEQNLIIKRYTHCFVMLNLFPYNAGHLLVVPYEHCPTLPELAQNVRYELIEIASVCTTVLTESLQAEGFNIGFNTGGKAAGGSIPEHLHLHILPRWSGDTGFLTTLAETKPISANLATMYSKLCNEFQKL